MGNRHWGGDGRGGAFTALDIVLRDGQGLSLEEVESAIEGMVDYGLVEHIGYNEDGDKLWRLAAPGHEIQDAIDKVHNGRR
jgi:hypothetical protein